MSWRATGEGYEELLDAEGRIVAAFGPNPYGMMGQDWRRGWTFDPVTTKATGTMVWRPGTPRPTMREALEKAVAAPPPLSKDQIRAVLNEHDVRHTEACRDAPGNKKGTGGNDEHPLGGYVCRCDWEARVRALLPTPARDVRTSLEATALDGPVSFPVVHRATGAPAGEVVVEPGKPPEVKLLPPEVVARLAAAAPPGGYGESWVQPLNNRTGHIHYLDVVMERQRRRAACPTCDGKGRVPAVGQDDGGAVTVACPACDPGAAAE